MNKYTLIIGLFLICSINMSTKINAIALNDTSCIHSCNNFKKCVLDKEDSIANCKISNICPGGSNPCETDVVTSNRKSAISDTRDKKTLVLTHRGWWTAGFLENSLAAYKSSLIIGSDGNEIDVRKSKDGVLINFHDDYTDRLTNIIGKPEEFSFEEIRSSSLRVDQNSNSQFNCIPSFIDTMILHQQMSGLIHLDIKNLTDKTIQKDIIDILDALDMWEHLVSINPEATTILSNFSKINLITNTIGLTDNRDDLSPRLIKNSIKSGYKMLLVDDPRRVLDILKNETSRNYDISSLNDVTCSMPHNLGQSTKTLTEQEIISRLLYAPNWNRIPSNDAERTQFAAEIIDRANAAMEASKISSPSKELIDALTKRVKSRSLHTDWLYHGLDAQEALRSLILLKASNAPTLVRQVLWRIDEENLKPIHSQTFWKDYPISWIDFRIKEIVWEAIQSSGDTRYTKIIRNYLDLNTDKVLSIGRDSREAAVKTLIKIRPTEKTGLFLLNKNGSVIKRRAIIELVKYSNEHHWVNDLLDTYAQYARKW